MISVIVSSCGRPQLLQNCLDSIQRQVLIESLDVVVLKSDLNQERLDGLKEAKGEILFFLDEDCELPDPLFLERMLKTLQLAPLNAVLGGHYLNKRKCSYGAKAYNSLCNQWINVACRENKAENLLGGAFATRRSVLEPLAISSAAFWGGEDTYLFRKLRSAGNPLIFNRDISVIHNDQSCLRKWVRRAFLHGYNRNRYNLGSREFRLRGDTLKETFKYFPYYLLHFSVLALGVSTHSFVAQASFLKNLFVTNQHKPKKAEVWIRKV